MALAMREATDCHKTIGVMTQSGCFYRWHDFMKEHAPNMFDPVKTKKKEIRFINGGKILLHSVTRCGVCSSRFDIFIIDNVAIFKISRDSIHTIIPSMANESKFVVTSTGDTGDFEFERYGFHTYRVNEESKHYKRKIKHLIKNLT
jgi:hypothetical protein